MKRQNNKMFNNKFRISITYSENTEYHFIFNFYLLIRFFISLTV